MIIAMESKAVLTHPGVGKSREVLETNMRMAGRRLALAAAQGLPN